MTGEAWTPQKAANRLVRIAEAYNAAHQLPRFPVNVEQLALGAAQVFGWADPISEVRAASIPSFEGALISDDGRKKWMLLYNDSLTSKGRIRFTKAHELGHYILHRLRQDAFQCSSEDMLNWSPDEKDMEGQADLFASYLLMPLDDFRKQLDIHGDFEVLGACADRYGVSLTAATLKWLSYTDEKAVILMSRDGFIDWAWSSDAAFKAGAFFRTKAAPVQIPAGSLAADGSVRHDRNGISVSAAIWFPNADPKLTVLEMKVSSDQYDKVLTLLRLPRYAEVWKPRVWNEDSSQ